MDKILLLYSHTEDGFILNLIRCWISFFFYSLYNKGELLFEVFKSNDPSQQESLSIPVM